MKITRKDGSVVNITVNYNATLGDVDKNGHRIFCTDEEILDFIDGVDLEPISVGKTKDEELPMGINKIISKSNELEDEASKLLNE